MRVSRYFKTVYNTPRWKALRARFLRENPICKMCPRLATIVDHIVPMRDGGPAWDWDNLQPLCQRCHSGTKQRQDNQSSALGNPDPITGWPRDPNHPVNKFNR